MKHVCNHTHTHTDICRHSPKKKKISSSTQLDLTSSHRSPTFTRKQETLNTKVPTGSFALTLPRGKLLRKAGVRFVCPKVKAGGLLATLRRAPLYWAAIWALKARQFSGYVYRVWKEGRGNSYLTINISFEHVSNFL